MSRTMTIALMAGVALGMGNAAALAQSANLDESRAYQAELLADAQGRTSLLQAGTSGYDGKFFLASPDGNYRLNIGGQIQTQYVIAQAEEDDDDDDDGDEDDDTAIGFRLRRTRLNFGGNLFNPNFSYYIQGGFSDVGDDEGNGSFTLLDAFGKYKFENNWMMRFGQFKLPLFREELVSSKYQLAVDRSAVNSVFSQGRSQGIEFGFEQENVRGAFAFSDGLGTANTDFTSGAEADYALTGRIEFKWAGAWNQFEDFTSWTNSDFAGMIGGAIHWQDGGETIGTADSELLAYTVDASVEGNGWNLFGAFVGSHGESEDTDEDSDIWGVVVQGGIFVQEQTELFARYDVILPDEDDDDDDDGDEGGDDPFNTITAGVNYYFIPRSHAAKFTADFAYFLDEPGDSGLGTNSALGLLSSEDDGNWAVRLQMQVLF